MYRSKCVWKIPIEMTGLLWVALSRQASVDRTIAGIQNLRRCP
jgi:hypothetical protein